MGRRRQHVDPAEPLPAGLYKMRRQYRARRLAQPWVYFGSEYKAAIAAFEAWRNPQQTKTVAWLLDMCAAQMWPAKVKALELSARTCQDYKRDIGVLKKGLGKIPLVALQPSHINTFREVRATAAPAHVRNELACLSAALQCAVSAGHIHVNVAREVKRPTKAVRDRLITDAEYLAVYKFAHPSVRLAMTLAVRTLGLPSDVLRMGPRNVKEYDDLRTLRFARGKTGVKVEVAIVGELAAVLQPFLDHPTLHPTFVRKVRAKHAGKAYTVMGIGAMFRRACDKAGVKDFGLRDLRAKGATDMFRAGVELRQIQLLLGHKSVRTTEVYLKGLLAEIVRPNELPIVAAA